MRATASLAFALLLALGLGFTLQPRKAMADPPKGWHTSLEQGVEAAGRSGKPILLITAWKRTL